MGLELDSKGAIVVDKYSHTNVDSIWALGDITNRLNLTPVALIEGMAFAATVFGNKPTACTYDKVGYFTLNPIFWASGALGLRLLPCLGSLPMERLLPGVNTLSMGE